jgi:hypothetical protein
MLPSFNGYLMQSAALPSYNDTRNIKLMPPFVKAGKEKLNKHYRTHHSVWVSYGKSLKG